MSSMSDQELLDALYPKEDRSAIAARAGLAEADLVLHVRELEPAYKDVLRERGDMMTPEEADAFAEHCSCEYQ